MRKIVNMSHQKYHQFMTIDINNNKYYLEKKTNNNEKGLFLEQKTPIDMVDVNDFGICRIACIE